MEYVKQVLSESGCEVLLVNQIWSVVSLPPLKKAIICKCVFRINENLDGSVNKLKAQRSFYGSTTRLCELWSFISTQSS